MAQVRHIARIVGTAGVVAALCACARVDGSALSHLAVSNVTPTSFTVSWISESPEEGTVRHGPSPSEMTGISVDVRGAGTVSRTHLVTVSGIPAGSTRYFDVVSGATVDSNGGAHYSVALPAVLPLPTSFPFQIYGRAEKGGLPAEGALVRVRVRDRDGQGTSGASQVLSCLVDADGWWTVNAGWRLDGNLASPFSFSEESDGVVAVCRDGEGASSLDVLTGSCQPSAVMALQPRREGDVDGDGEVTVTDVVRCLRMAVGIEGMDVAGGDLDGDLLVTIADVIRILRKVVGLP